METIILAIVMLCSNMTQNGKLNESTEEAKVRCVKEKVQCVLLDKSPSPHVKFANCVNESKGSGK